MSVPPPESAYAILGLVDKSPGSGYDLASLADRTLGYFWPLSHTLVYSGLARLGDLGWVDGVDVAQDRRPDKRVWSSTRAGRDALADWLLSPAKDVNDFRSGFLLKFMFGARMPRATLSSLLADYRESLLTTLEDLGATAQQLRDKPEARMGRLAALHGHRTAEARLAWLDVVEEEMAVTSEVEPTDVTEQPHRRVPPRAART